MKTFFPNLEHQERFYYVCLYCKPSVSYSFFQGLDSEYERINSGNSFKTESEAEKFLSKIKKIFDKNL